MQEDYCYMSYFSKDLSLSEDILHYFKLLTSKQY